jgi:FKBP-type peptidyl-prolyl cis-trans isomerase (trigger factor)
MRVLTQITEEMMISAYAADQGIQVNDEDLDKAVAVIKADYPDNTFEETLLENAISFQFWRKQLATRLLVEKVIAKELVLPVQITSEDIAEYVKTNYPNGLPEDQNADEFNQKIIKHLRQQKAEVAYKEWIEGLRNRYPVEINRIAWDRMVGGAS